MNHLLRRAVAAAGFTAFAVLPVCAATSAASSSAASFASQSPSAYELSACVRIFAAVADLAAAAVQLWHRRAQLRQAAPCCLRIFRWMRGRNLDIRGALRQLRWRAAAAVVGGDRAVSGPRQWRALCRLHLCAQFGPAAAAGAVRSTATGSTISQHRSLLRQWRPSASAITPASPSRWSRPRHGISPTPQASMSPAISSSRNGAPLGFDTNLPDRTSTNAIGLSGASGPGRRLGHQARLQRRPVAA